MVIGITHITDHHAQLAIHLINKCKMSIPLPNCKVIRVVYEEENRGFIKLSYNYINMVVGCV